MLPSKIIPTSSAFLLMTGLPELPPMMSAVQTKLSGVLRSRLLLCFSHRGGRSNGGLFPCSFDHEYIPSKLVNGGTGLPFSMYPFRVTSDRRRVSVASG